MNRATTYRAARDDTEQHQLSGGHANARTYLALASAFTTPRLPARRSLRPSSTSPAWPCA
ncbi:hypothetical protein [Streptomyces sp. NPDC048111]|uniref:hypothetical protein n=1 Tax=Streptomyces sp. NPDC048111 TaxID=3365500 RepID=UPI00371A391E